MKNGKKLIVIGALVALSTIILGKKASAAPPPGDIVIDVYDSEGNLVPHHSPILLDEGGSYTVKLTIKNTSLKGDVPWAATLGIGISAAVGTLSLITSRVDSVNFGAGEIKTFTYPFSVSMGTGNQSGGISAWIQAPTGATITSAQAELSVKEVPIMYGATVTFG